MASRAALAACIMVALWCAGVNGDALTDACRPLGEYSAAEAAAWLDRLGYNSTLFAAEEVKGFDLVNFAEAGRETWRIFESYGVRKSKIPALVNLVAAQKSPPGLHLPPTLDPCSAFYGKGMDVRTTMLLEKVIELDTDKYTFEVIFRIAFMWYEDRVRWVPPASQAELDACDPDELCGYLGARDCPEGVPCAISSRGMTASKCCSVLWTPDSAGYNGIMFVNAKGWEVVYRDGPSIVAMPGSTSASLFVALRIRGTFFIPMSYAAFPNDEQDLDIHLTTQANTSVFKFTVSDGVYLQGGEFLPKEERAKFNQDVTFEDLSGWTIDRDIKMLQKESSTEQALWLNSKREPKFPIQNTMIGAMAMMSQTTPDMLMDYWRSCFVIMRIHIVRKPYYFIENIVTPVILLNGMNVLVFFLSPKSVETRLGSCGTMILALMAFQTVVADQLPQTGYSTAAQNFLKISSSYMIGAAGESLLVFGLRVHVLSPVSNLASIAGTPLGEIAGDFKIMILDHTFIYIYIWSFSTVVTQSFYSNDAYLATCIGGAVLLVLIACIYIPVWFKMRKRLWEEIGHEKDKMAQEEECHQNAFRGTHLTHDASSEALQGTYAVGLEAAGREQKDAAVGIDLSTPRPLGSPRSSARENPTRDIQLEPWQAAPAQAGAANGVAFRAPGGDAFGSPYGMIVSSRPNLRKTPPKPGASLPPAKKEVRGDLRWPDDPSRV